IRGNVGRADVVDVADDPEWLDGLVPASRDGIALREEGEDERCEPHAASLAQRSRYRRSMTRPSNRSSAARRRPPRSMWSIEIEAGAGVQVARLRVLRHVALEECGALWP